MEERELGPVEQKISDGINLKVASDPTALELSTGIMSDADFEGLSPGERQIRIAGSQMRISAAYREAILQLAREIDAINAAADGGH